jgi:hypothetical protein
MDELRAFAAIGLGLLAGALLMEAAVLVPYWRSISAQAFRELHHGVAPRLYAYFAPVTVGAVVVSVASGALAAASGPEVTRDWLAIASGVLALMLLGFYRWYFETANQRLPELARLDTSGGLAAELRRWQLLHLLRTAVCLCAFVGAVGAL